MQLREILKYYHTIKYLKWIQVRYQLWYRLQKMIGYTPKIPTAHLSEVVQLPTFRSTPIKSYTAWLGNGQFKFLNIQHEFGEVINWNMDRHGKLWTYNLNYFEFLLQENMSAAEGRALIADFIKKENEILDGMESFPTSLRIIFWVKFLSINKINNSFINASLYRQMYRLSAQPEYHLLGNHLLENGFGLLFGGVYFADKKIIRQAIKIITQQLQEQILSDGAHFELSPMYHQIMVYRILDSIHLLRANRDVPAEHLLVRLENKAALMLGWMKQLTINETSMLCLNDATDGVAPTARDLFRYAKWLGIDIRQVPLGASGYRRFSNEKIDAIVDVGHVGPDYIPGHAHSDTFNFVLYYGGQPLIVDTGISTYEKNKKRTLERSTSAHNTVKINRTEQSEMWGGFRVGRRARVTVLDETPDTITASHDGYQHLGCTHRRRFSIHPQQFEIRDVIEGKGTGQAYFHFHPEIVITRNTRSVAGAFWEMKFDGCDELIVE
ncbi:MAG: alginate lyase family protein, partial [Bacteroidota bacterium]